MGVHVSRAALRDASWYRNPSTSGKALRYHMVAEEIHKGESACGVPVIADECLGLIDATVDAATVPASQRCGKPGCRVRWPK